MAYSINGYDEWLEWERERYEKAEGIDWDWDGEESLKEERESFGMKLCHMCGKEIEGGKYNEYGKDGEMHVCFACEEKALLGIYESAKKYFLKRAEKERIPEEQRERMLTEIKNDIYDSALDYDDKNILVRYFGEIDERMKKKYGKEWKSELENINDKIELEEEAEEHSKDVTEQDADDAVMWMKEKKDDTTEDNDR